MTKGIDYKTGEKIIEKPDQLPLKLSAASRLAVPDHHDGDGDDDFEKLIEKKRAESQAKDEDE